MSVQERRERERAERHRLIVTTARQLAEAEGWDAVTTRRLAERIEYSQPVLYSHFTGMDAIVAAVAVEGFVELATAMAEGRASATTPADALADLARAYLAFADANPALYDAMFTLRTDLAFAREDTPAPLRAAFEEFRVVVAPIARGRAEGTFAEVTWSALHGLATLTRAGRMRPEQQSERLDLLLAQLLAAPSG